jgi:charged multivesicular body protein 1
MGNTQAPSPAQRQQQMMSVKMNLKLTSRRLEKPSDKCRTKEKKKKKEVKKAIEAGNIEIARVYAEQAVREQKQAMTYLRLSSRLDGVLSRVESAMAMAAVTPQMEYVCRAMATVQDDMDPEKLVSIMDKFASLDEDAQVISSVVEESMGGTLASTTPEDEVDGLLLQVGEEHALDVTSALHSAPTSALSGATDSAAAGAAATSGVAAMAT